MLPSTTIPKVQTAPLRYRLKLCPTCSGQVSQCAAACPHCGEPIRSHTIILDVALGVILGLFGIGVICAFLGILFGIR